MENLDVKRRIAMTGIKRGEFAAMIDAEAQKSTGYHVTLPDLSTAYNCKGRPTEKQRWIIETALVLLRKIESGEIDPYGKE